MNENKSDISFNVNPGKNIDSAFGDVIRKLLAKPAEEMGNLLGDGIGILSDRIKLKREKNLRDGLSEVRKRIDIESVNYENIKEEEAYILITGLSLSEDQKVREMWANLFAASINSNSNAKAERPYISVLQSLSPTDAKILDYICLVRRKESEFRKNILHFEPADRRKITDEERKLIDNTRQENKKNQDLMYDLLNNKAEEYGLASALPSGWSDNLTRQGLIERNTGHSFSPMSIPATSLFSRRTLNERSLEITIENLSKQISYLEEANRRISSPPSKLFPKNRLDSRRIEIQLTGFGTRFSHACGILQNSDI
jgi:hypothetical protein